MELNYSSADLYCRLGLTKDADLAAIKKAYRQLAIRLHPDKAGGSEEQFKLVAEAYAILSDAEKRRLYDATGEAALADLDLDGMMAEVFEEGGWFEQMVANDPLMAEMAKEEGMAGMQKSFGSFFAAAMGGGGSVYMPDGSQMDMPKIKMPSLAELMDGSHDPEERLLMEKVAKKMGLGERGALVPGTGMAALDMLQKLGTDPSFWDSDDDGNGDEDEDAFLDELQQELRGKASVGDGGGGDGGSSGGRGPAHAMPAAERSRTQRRDDLSDEDGLVTSARANGVVYVKLSCFASPAAGKAWLDAARNGQLRELESQITDEPTLIHFHGAGLGQTALHWAASKGHEKVVEWLLSLGAPVEARNANGATPLHAAAAAGEAVSARLLLNAGADAEARNSEGLSCASAASAKGHSDLAALLRGGSIRTATEGTRSHAAHGHEQRRERRRGEAACHADQGDNESAVRAAASRGDASALIAALDALNDPTVRQKEVDSRDDADLTPLHLVCRVGCAEGVAALLRAKADVGARSKKGNTPLAVAAKHAQWPLMEELLRAGASCDGVAMVQSVRRGSSNALLCRLRDAGGLGLDGECEGTSRSALMTAAAAGEAACVTRLLDLRADATMEDANGATALHYCADKGDVACAEALLRGGARLEAADVYGNTALHAAGRRGHKKLFAALLEAGADAGARNTRGREPKLLDAADADAACAVM